MKSPLKTRSDFNIKPEKQKKNWPMNFHCFKLVKVVVKQN